MTSTMSTKVRLGGCVNVFVVDVKYMLAMSLPEKEKRKLSLVVV